MTDVIMLFWDLGRDTLLIFGSRVTSSFIFGSRVTSHVEFNVTFYSLYVPKIDVGFKICIYLFMFTSESINEM